MAKAMTEDHPRSDGAPSWVTYLALTAATFCASMIGGWFNRMENRAKHEQLLGKIEEVQRGMKAIEERSKR